MGLIILNTGAADGFTVTFTAGPNGSVSGSTSQEIESGGSTAAVNVEPLTEPDYQFVRWTVSGGGSGEIYSDLTDPGLIISNVQSDLTLTANFAIKTFILTFTSGGAGKILVGDALYEDRYVETVEWGGVSSEVTAVPDESSTFAGWTGDYTSNNLTIQIGDVQSDMQVTFDTVPEIPGCSTGVTLNYSGGFNPADFDLINVEVDTVSGHFKLNTGVQGIDPDNIVIPFKQDVYVTFLYEGAGFKRTDFGWMLASDGPGGTRHEIYSDVNDNDKDGILDGQTDINADGVVDRHDNKRFLGTFDGGSEIVFYLDATDNGCDAWCGGEFFTKREWNTDAHGRWPDDPGVSRLIKLYDTGGEGDTDHWPYVAGCGGGVRELGWLDQGARERLLNDFGFNLRAPVADDPPGFNTECIDELNGTAPTHAIVGAPDETPFAWVIGFDDTTMDDPDKFNDYDYNDVVFLIERKTGGMAQLQSSKSIVPNESDAYFTAVEVAVYDYHPSGECQGKTSLNYYVSADNGAPGSWVEITAWDKIQAFTLDADGNKILGEQIEPASWIPGSPEYIQRSRRIDLAGLGRTGKKLIWKVELISEHQDCVPQVVDVELNAETASHGIFSRSSPIVQANVIYAGSYETPDVGWQERVNRGHLTASRLYDPEEPNLTLTGDQTLWDAGDKLTAMDPGNRRIYFPQITVYPVTEEELLDENGDAIRGDGVTRTFRGSLAHYPVAATSVRIYDDQEIFTDQFTDELEGNFNGTGTIERFTGEWTVTFQAPPMNNVPIKASYAYYTTSSTLQEFTEANVDNNMLALTNEFLWPSGYTHDFSGDGNYTEADGDWLVQWIRGYRQPGAGQKKEWLLGPIDHSTPALLVPPGFPAWYFGSQVTEDERESYNTFRSSLQDRDTVLFVGSRDGMIHAFDAGKFRYDDNPETPGIEENRGFFLWEPKTNDSPAYCDDYINNCPNYGTGKELWAFIPANLIPRLKNNILRADDQAFVDASPALSDAYIDTNGDGIEDAWRTILLSAEGNGGDTVFCLDITDPAQPFFMWEFAAPELFRSRSSPAVSRIGRIQDPLTNRPKWVAFFVTGKVENADLFPAVYIIDVSNGSVLHRVVLDDAADLNGDGFIAAAEADYGRGGVPSGQPAIVDSDENGFIDRLYVSSDKGVMYKVNVPDDPNNPNYPITHCVLNADFTDENGNTVSPTQRWHPVYASPTIVVDNVFTPTGDIEYRIMVFFGTGDNPYYDEDINTADTRYHFFAYVDTANKGECDPNKHFLDWYIELGEGHRIFASAFAAAGQIYFGTSTAETEDPCESHGQTGGNDGEIVVTDLDGTILLQQLVGDIRTSPLVEDQHVYFRTPTGLHSMGSGIYNNEVQAAGTPAIQIRAWQELD